jgi:TonB family protein
MTKLHLAAAAALLLAAQASPAFAFSTVSHVKLIALAPTAVSIVGSPEQCNVPARIDGSAYFEYPLIAQEQGVGGTTQLKIDITSNGALADEQIFSSSRNYWLDSAALRSARLTRFTPEVRDCRRVAGSYLYEVDF